MGKPTTLATAIVSSLNASVTLAEATTFYRRLLPVLKIDDVGSPAGYVYVSNTLFGKLNRCNDYDETIDINVYLIAQITNTTGLPTDSDVAAKLDLVDSIVDHMKNAGKLDGYQLIEIDVPAPFDHDRVFQESIFDCTLTLRYKGF